MEARVAIFADYFLMGIVTLLLVGREKVKVARASAVYC